MLEEKCVVRLKNGERSLREDTVKRLGGPRQKVCRARSLLLADPDGSEACIDHVIAKICRCHGGKRALPPPARWLPADHRQQAPSLPTNPQATIPRPLIEPSARISCPGTRPGSCLRPPVAGRPHLQAREPHVTPWALVRVAPVLHDAHPLLPVRPQALQFCCICAAPRAGRIDQAQAEVVHPAECRSIDMFSDSALYVQQSRKHRSGPVLGTRARRRLRLA